MMMTVFSSLDNNSLSEITKKKKFKSDCSFIRSI